MSRRRPPASRTERPSTRNPSLIFEHLGLAVSLVILIAASSKVLVVAHGDPVTVSALSRHLDLGGLLTIVLVSGAPALASVFAFLSASALMEAVREEDALGGPVIAFAFGVVLALALAPKAIFAPFMYFAVIALASSFALRLWRRRRRLSNKPLIFLLRNHPTRVNARWVLAVTGILASATVVLSDAPWLPKERLEFSTGEAQVGYVVAEGGGVTIMSEADRTVTVRPAEDISERRLCQSTIAWLPEGGGGRSVLADLLWAQGGDYEACGEE